MIKIVNLIFTVFLFSALLAEKDLAKMVKVNFDHLQIFIDNVDKIKNCKSEEELKKIYSFMKSEFNPKKETFTLFRNGNQVIGNAFESFYSSAKQEKGTGGKKLVDNPLYFVTLAKDLDIGNKEEYLMSAEEYSQAKEELKKQGLAYNCIGFNDDHKKNVRYKDATELNNYQEKIRTAHLSNDAKAIVISEIHKKIKKEIKKESDLDEDEIKIFDEMLIVLGNTVREELKKAEEAENTIKRMANQEK